jgi:4-phospho-D-threonate 3-dehydrogenase / 4-phospho-D-erythronate 3-dehydrogenase
MNHEHMHRPRIALTMGDVAGIGPEIIVRACRDPSVHASCAPLVVGDPQILERAVRLVGEPTAIRRLDSPRATVDDGSSLACWNPPSRVSSAQLAAVRPGAIDAQAGRAAHDWLVAAAGAALAGSVDAIVTAPLNKAALHAAGIDEPGHTELLARACNVERYAMMLFVPPGGAVRSPHGLSVAHVTLHTSVRSVPELLTADGVADKIGLVHDFLSRIGLAAPRIGVCALNPHAGEEGLFGDEEQRIIQPGIERAAAAGIVAHGPIAADALFRRAISGEFDGVVAMYHDQGHIPIKLVAREAAINITLGLPIIRTSPSHGTAFDIAWKGIASPQGMVAAIQVAARVAGCANASTVPT